MAVEDALHPNLAAQLSPIPRPPLPTAESRTERVQAGNVPCQVSLQPPMNCASLVPVRLPACQKELEPEIEMQAVAELSEAAM